MSVSWDFKVTKPICFILHGHSLEELDRRIEEFKDFDVLWTSLNQYEIADNIVKKIGKKLDFVILYCQYREKPTHCPVLEASEARGNSLLEFIFQAMENNVEHLFLFGADGYSKGFPHYYGIKEYSMNWHQRFEEDTKYLNGAYPRTGKLNVYNISPNSAYGVIPNYSYNECLTFLKKLASS